MKIKNIINKGGVVLMYHRIFEREYDAWNICVTPKNFEEHVSILKKYFNLLNLKNYMEIRQKKNKIIKRYAVVTFDDGYSDNYYYGKPLLEKHDVPATLFVVAGAVDKRSEFWWDQLARIVYDNYETIIKNYPDIMQKGKHDDINLQAMSKLEVCKIIHEHLQTLKMDEREQVLQSISKHNTTNRKPDKNDLPLTNEQIREMTSNKGIFEIGAHTISHPLLSRLSIDEQREEIEGGKNKLEELIDEKVVSISYPHGDYNNTTLDIIKESNYKYGCTVKKGKVYHSSNYYEIPRIKVLEWTGEEFENRIQQYL